MKIVITIIFLLFYTKVYSKILSPTNYQVERLVKKELLIQHSFKDVSNLSYTISSLDSKRELQIGKFSTKISYSLKVLNFRGDWLVLRVFSNSKLLDSVIFGRGFVFLTAGQSNTTNSHKALLMRSEKKLVSALERNGEYQLLDTNEYGDIVPIAYDYYLASFKGRSSVWPYVGDKLVQKYNVPVAFVNIGWSGSSIERWTRISKEDEEEAVVGLKNRFDYARGIDIDAVLWHQGEADSVRLASFKNSKEQRIKYDQYRKNLESVIRESRFILSNAKLPWLVSVTSRICKWPGEPDIEKHDLIIEKAQKDLIYNSDLVNIFAGPNTNKIEHICHFDSVKSLLEYRDAWFGALVNYLN